MEAWAYEDVLAFAQSWGAVYFVLMFVGVLIYAFWPKNRHGFQRAKKIPLDDEDA
jgi:cytochrome c oxidase cbb3-type subunit 4